ncbi:hypothetical protein AB0I77_50370 [Streptomyces sp. NPDC050619]|uniref:hypothetical protein n=1 Tax=Streptomyces sp. NPDC050619 TaxID=3157214 RepID=UPI0034188CE5
MTVDAATRLLSRRSSSDHETLGMLLAVTSAGRATYSCRNLAEQPAHHRPQVLPGGRVRELDFVPVSHVPNTINGAEHYGALGLSLRRPSAAWG